MDDATPVRPRKRPRREPAPTTPDPIEIAMEAEAHDGRANSPAQRVLLKHETLIGWQIASERAGFALKILLASAGVATGALLGYMAWTASRADGLLIEAFDSPPELQAEGYTGGVLAAQLQDKLGRMQRETVSRDAAASVRDVRSADIHVQIPYAGVSLGEVDRMLRSSLGRETPVRGEVVRVASGPDAGSLAATVRVGTEPGSRVLAKDGDVDSLVQQAAEKVYEARDLERFVFWLIQHDRADDGLAVVRRYEKLGTVHQQAVAQSFLGGRLAQAGEATEPHLRLAVRLDPGHCGAINDLGTAEWRAGRVQASLQHWSQSLSCDQTRHGLSDEGRRFTVALRRANVAAALLDAPSYIAANCLVLGVTPCSPNAVAAAAETGDLQSQIDPGFAQRLPAFARNMARLHDVDGAARMLAAHLRAGGDQGPPAEWLQTSSAVAFAREDWENVLQSAAAADALQVPGYERWSGGPAQWRPYALARLGRRNEALTAAAAQPSDCYPCIVLHAKALAVLGDRAGAEGRFAEAERQGPSLPHALTEWGAFRLSLRDADGAIAKLKVANKRSPRYPDALEVWGEALLANGDARGATAKLAQAARIAPWWGRLHLKLGEALAKAGKTAEAKAEFKFAATLFLTADERAELARVQAAK